MSQPSFEHQDLHHATFQDVSLRGASFEDVALSNARFNNVNLQGATFSDINFSHVVITESCIEGLLIDGFNINELIEAEKQRRGATTRVEG